MLESEYKIILDCIAEGIFTIDKYFNITFFNHAAEQITGFSKKVALGKKCFEIFKTNICENKCALKESFRTGKKVINLKANIIHISGRVISVELSTALIKHSNGKIIGGVETFRDCSHEESLRKVITKNYTFQDIISKSPKIKEIFDVLPDIARTNSTVLIQGPSGSGKELFARAIHNLSSRNKASFIPVNCGAIPINLLESELFGHLKGAFTDAKQNRPGKFNMANKGTLFLDEIGDLPQVLQVKLLRVIQEHEYEPLGSVSPIKADVRLVLASNKNIKNMVASGEFREDLFYRINVFKIDIPSLSQRREDIPILIDHFIRRHSYISAKNIEGVSNEVMEFFLSYHFPGNIRELENIIEHAFILCKDHEIAMRHLPKDLNTFGQALNASLDFSSIEAQLIKKTLEKYHNNRKLCAKELKINPSTLWRKMKKYGLK